MEDKDDTPIKLEDLEFPRNNVIGQGAFGKVRLAIIKKTGEKSSNKKSISR